MPNIFFVIFCVFIILDSVAMKERQCGNVLSEKYALYMKWSIYKRTWH